MPAHLSTRFDAALGAGRGRERGRLGQLLRARPRRLDAAGQALIAELCAAGLPVALAALNRYRQDYIGHPLFTALTQAVCARAVSDSYAQQADQWRAWAALAGVDDARSGLVAQSADGELHLRRGGHRDQALVAPVAATTTTTGCGQRRAWWTGENALTPALRGAWAHSPERRCHACAEWAVDTRQHYQWDERQITALDALTEPERYPLFGARELAYVLGDSARALLFQLRGLYLRALPEAGVRAPAEAQLAAHIYACAIERARSERSDRTLAQAADAAAEPELYAALRARARRREHSVSSDGPLGGLIPVERWHLALSALRERLLTASDPQARELAQRHYLNALVAALRDTLGD